ncbi:hypothetical protein T484DRAFT_1835497 [Baffinella frigidus]|nr:hypothetical protein T484DRAFT_1835497 [Cryptophyta sp. CCMP2293]
MGQIGAVRQLGAGETLGEIGVLVSETATADVRAINDMHLLQIAARDLYGLLRRYPELYMTLKRQGVQNLRRACTGAPPPGLLDAQPRAVATLRRIAAATHCDLDLAPWDNMRIAAASHCDLDLASMGHRRLIPAGERIASVDKDANSLLVLDQGVVRMERDGLVITTLYAGDLIGEVATMIAKKHLLDARAVTCVELLEIHASDLEIALAQHPALNVALAQHPTLNVHLIQLGAQAMARDRLLLRLHSPHAINGPVKELTKTLTELDVMLHQEGSDLNIELTKTLTELDVMLHQEGSDLNIVRDKAEGS